ncbi:hypothetical protein VUR80DRAFT_3750 [Thermomyces stellatus]
MNSAVFNEEAPQGWPLFTTIPELRSKFQPGTKFIVAIGGWGDTEGFDAAARDEETRARWSRNVAKMVHDLGADGVDVDWEYPGYVVPGWSTALRLSCPATTRQQPLTRRRGNGDDYKQVPNSEKAWEIAAYPLLLKSLRKVLGQGKLITAAFPGLERDMLAFTPETIPQILESVDFINVMTYDMLNRRDNVTNHQSGIALSRTAIEAYMARGATPDKLNLGLPFFVKWFLTEPCPNPENAIGCPMPLLEDPQTGSDLGKSGAFSFHDEVPAELAPSYNRALTEGKHDKVGGGYYYWDAGENRFWTFDTPQAIRPKFPVLVEGMGLGGVFAWGLGEDANEFAHLKVVDEELRRLAEKKRAKKESKSEL